MEADDMANVVRMFEDLVERERSNRPVRVVKSDPVGNVRDPFQVTIRPPYPRARLMGQELVKDVDDELYIITSWDVPEVIVNAIEAEEAEKAEADKSGA